jgi:hypothetical protein
MHCLLGSKQRPLPLGGYVASCFVCSCAAS